MFSLIITIISIALVTALALATIYYGGSAFRQGADAAGAARLINEGQQLAGATAIYESVAGTDLTFPDAANVTQATLKTANALSSTITSFGETAAGRTFEASVASGKICDKVNEKAGIARLATSALVTATANYGCYGGTAGSAAGVTPVVAATAGTMVFKF